ncbi:MAG: sulfatase [Planctomycetota bacterium]
MNATRRRALLGALLAALPACSRSETPEALRPHIVLVVADALRADHLELYGYERPTAPRLAAWAQEALVFERATAPSNWTRPSMHALFTGRAPPPDRVYAPSEALPAHEPVLPELLSAAGYETLAVSANPFLSPRHGAERGFKHFVDLSLTRDQYKGRWKDSIASPYLLQRLEQLLDERAAPADDAPVFLYLHFMDPHLPYDPPPEQRHFCAPDYDGPLDGSDKAFVALRGEFVDERLPVADREQALALYDGEIARFDESFARLRELLAEKLPPGRPLVTILTADHGEAFGEGERGAYLHGIGLGPELLHVPLVVQGVPRGVDGTAVESGRIAARVGLVDLLPTLVNLAGARMPQDAEPLAGVDLLSRAAVRPGRSFIAYRALPRHNQGDLERGNGELAVLRDGWRAERLGLPTERGETWRLFDDASGREHTVEQPEDLALLRAAAERWLALHAAEAEPPPAEVELSPQTEQTLEALGYTGR